MNTDQEILKDIVMLLPDNMTAAEWDLARNTAITMKYATPGRGGDRVKMLRDLGWEHGVCYKLDMQYVIAIWCVLEKADELWARMPRRGRPKTLTTTGAVA